MLKNAEAFSSFSVDNLDLAKDFYGSVLGLEVSTNAMGLLEITLANGYKVLVYPKPDHQPATFTVLNFRVENIETMVQELKQKQVPFESYDLPHLKTGTDNISRNNAGPSVAWFRDPAGNILALIQGATQ